MRDLVGSTYLAMTSSRIWPTEADREFELRCIRCDRVFLAVLSSAEMLAAYRTLGKIPRTPSPRTLMDRIARAARLHDLAIGHVCIPPNFHKSIDDAATWYEKFESLSAYFAERAAEALRVSGDRIPAQLEITLV